MGEEQKKKLNLKQDALLENIAPEPTDHGSTVLLTGFLGKSTKEGYWRLYLTPALNDYFEIAEADIVHSQSMENHSPLGGTMLWVKRTAVLDRHQTVSNKVHAEFLDGSITSQFLTGASPVMRAGDLHLGSETPTTTIIPVTINVSARACGITLACAPPTPLCSHICPSQNICPTQNNCSDHCPTDRKCD